jgi:hypothetical protein
MHISILHNTCILLDLFNLTDPKNRHIPSGLLGQYPTDSFAA